MLSLYHSPFSLCSQKVRMALAEKNLTWQDHLVDLLQGEQFRPEFLALNPRAEVPVLVCGDAVLAESSLINEYLDEAYPEIRLSPVDPVLRHRMRHAALHIDRTIHSASGTLTYAILARPLLAETPAEQLEAMFSRTPEPVLRNWRRSILARGLEAPEIAPALEQHRLFFAWMESRLTSPHAWLSGPEFSLSDIAAFPYVMRADHLGLSDLFPAWQYPHLRSWYMRMLSRPSLKASFLDYVDGATQELMMQLVVAAQPQLAALLQPA